MKIAWTTDVDLFETVEYINWLALKSKYKLPDHWYDFNFFIKEIGKCPKYGFAIVVSDINNLNTESVFWSKVENGYSVSTNKKGQRIRPPVDDIPLNILKEATKNVKNKSNLEIKLYGSHKTGRANALKKRLLKEGINIEHWTNARIKKPWISKQKKTCNIEKLSHTQLRKRIIKDKLIAYICFICKSKPMWENKPLTLHLDHIDGNNKNNKLPNKKILLKLIETKTYKEIAEIYNVNPSTVSHAIRKYNE